MVETRAVVLLDVYEPCRSSIRPETADIVRSQRPLTREVERPLLFSLEPPPPSEPSRWDPRWSGRQACQPIGSLGSPMLETVCFGDSQNQPTLMTEPSLMTEPVLLAQSGSAHLSGSKRRHLAVCQGVLNRRIWKLASSRQAHWPSRAKCQSRFRSICSRHPPPLKRKTEAAPASHLSHDEATDCPRKRLAGLRRLLLLRMYS
jgi:hypothetical protein